MCLRLAGRQRMMRIDLYGLEKVHSAPNAPEGSNHGIKSPLRVAAIMNQFVNCGTLANRPTARTIEARVGQIGVTQPISCNLCEQEFDVQTYSAHARPHLPFPATIRVSRHAQLRAPRRNRQHARNGHEREPGVEGDGVGAEEQRHRRQVQRTSSRTQQDGESADRQQWWPSPKADSQLEQKSLNKFMLKAILKTYQTMRDQSSRVWGHSLDRGIEPRSGQRAKTDADSRRKGAARGARTHSSTTIREGILGLDQISSAEGQHGWHANGTRPINLLGSTGTPSAEPNLRRGSILQTGQNVQSRRQENRTLNIVSPERGLLVLEALGQTEAERKYGRAPPTAVKRELQVFLEDLLKTSTDHGEDLPR